MATAAEETGGAEWGMWLIRWGAVDKLYQLHASHIGGCMMTKPWRHTDGRIGLAALHDRR